MMDSQSLGPENSPENMQISNLASDFMRVSLHVISKAGFGIKLTWPGENRNIGQEKGSGTQDSQAGMLPGYTMSFFDATNIFMRNIVVVVVFGKKLISWYP